LGKPKDPAYWKKWRAAHAEYRERERARSQQRRLEGRRGDRSDEYRKRSARSRADREAELPPALDAHPLMRCAVCMVSAVMKRDRRDYVFDDLFEDAVAEALLSWASGEDPMVGIKRARSSAIGWRAKNVTGSPDRYVPEVD